MIRDEEVFYIGYIQKFRGLQGEVELLFTDDPFDRGTADYLVLNIDGINIPFFIEEYRFKNQDTAIIKFEDVDTEETAKKLVGAKVYYPTTHINNEDSEELSSLNALTGFTVYDENDNMIGTIDCVHDAINNPLLYIINADDEELVIPYHDDFLVNFDLKNRTIHLSLPEGILDIN